MMSAVRAPQSKPAIDRLLDLESIHQSDDVEGDYRLLSHCASLPLSRNARRAIAAQDTGRSTR
jgi:hypothetical protein